MRNAIVLAVQRALGRTMSVEVGYIRTNGNDFPLQRQFAKAIDRVTGQRPDDAIQRLADVLRPSAFRIAIHSRSITRSAGVWRPRVAISPPTSPPISAIHRISGIRSSTRGPTEDDVRHRLTGTLIYELPSLAGERPIVRGVAGGWQLSGILTARTGIGSLKIGEIHAPIRAVTTSM